MMKRRFFLWASLATVTLGATAAEKPATIAVQPLGGVKAERLAVVKQGLEKAFGVTVVLLENRPLPKSALYAPRGRYRADTLLEHLRDITKAEHPVVIGITEKDISTTKDEHYDWGIFGLGEIDGRACIVSTFRLGARGADEAKLRERLRKVAIHEVGHVTGLQHCDDLGCVMQDAEASIATVDRETGAFCEKCKAASLKWLQEKSK
ncbi:matrixin family metalloprotease [Luteolibacter flavescens]|uniref:Matrixin family metalloprotease n=1 Tax=Luteolibacter flavescens TaxID=1859460 RepID=A0ABT3FKY8_9BACT|nr:matrixin family metalloprotease [Luteolibacter flavescens]MCW1883660.1 matrixin family metalloprotease [Luteolibacter flavescens]